MKIEILGSGCAKCSTLADNAKKAVAILGIEATVEKVTDMKIIMHYGVMMTPALVVDGKVKTSGKMLSPDDIVALLKK